MKRGIQQNYSMKHECIINSNFEIMKIHISQFYNGLTCNTVAHIFDNPYNPSNAVLTTSLASKMGLFLSSMARKKFSDIVHN